MASESPEQLQGHPSHVELKTLLSNWNLTLMLPYYTD